jgi:hypothetical protein
LTWRKNEKCADEEDYSVVGEAQRVIAVRASSAEVRVWSGSYDEIEYRNIRIDPTSNLLTPEDRSWTLSFCRPESTTYLVRSGRTRGRKGGQGKARDWSSG